jgi:hypothetical protein
LEILRRLSNSHLTTKGNIVRASNPIPIFNEINIDCPK